MLEIKELFNNLVGSWQLRREITGYGNAKGIASFSYFKENHLHYKEEVDLVLHDSNSSNKARREYIYIYNPLEKNISQNFTNYNLFCNLIFSNENTVAKGNHICSLDSYKTLYHFLDNNTFTITYYVKGPNKNYIMKTEYIKMQNKC